MRSRVNISNQVTISKTIPDRLCIRKVALLGFDIEDDRIVATRIYAGDPLQVAAGGGGEFGEVTEQFFTAKSRLSEHLLPIRYPISQLEH